MDTMTRSASRRALAEGDTATLERLKQRVHGHPVWGLSAEEVHSGRERWLFSMTFDDKCDFGFFRNMCPGMAPHNFYCNTPAQQATKGWASILSTLDAHSVFYSRYRPWA